MSWGRRDGDRVHTPANPEGRNTRFDVSSRLPYVVNCRFQNQRMQVLVGFDSIYRVGLTLVRRPSARKVERDPTCQGTTTTSKEGPRVSVDRLCLRSYWADACLCTRGVNILISKISYNNTTSAGLLQQNGLSFTRK